MLNCSQPNITSLLLLRTCAQQEKRASTSHNLHQILAAIYLSDNTTLLIKPGTHNISSKILVANVTYFTMITESANSTVAITCSENFAFEHVMELYVDGLDFLGCTKNRMTSVGQFTIVNCIFDGLNFNGSVLTITNSTANIIDCLFTRIIMVITVKSSPPILWSLTVLWIPSVLPSHYRWCYHQHQQQCHNPWHRFERNAAEVGGAIYTEYNELDKLHFQLQPTITK